MAIKTRRDVFTEVDVRRRHRADLPVEPPAVADHRHPDPDQQADRRRQRLRPRGRHPSGRRAEGQARPTRSCARRSIGLASNKLVLGKHSGRHAFAERLEGARASTSPSVDMNEAFTALQGARRPRRRHLRRGPGGDRRRGECALADRYELRRSRASRRRARRRRTRACSMRVDGAERERRRRAATAWSTPASRRSPASSASSPKLERYQVNAITGGTDAQGEVSCPMRDERLTGERPGRPHRHHHGQRAGLRERAEQARVPAPPLISASSAKGP